MQHRPYIPKLSQGLLPALSLLLLLVVNVPARTVPDPGNPLAFFNQVADKLLRSTFSFGVTNIPVETNGVFVYSPAVQRLLQLSANITDAANTNFYPSVFRPFFSRDVNGNVFVTGYTNVASVTGANDFAFSQPIEATALASPVGDQVLLNVYGVPWIIGAKKGLPNFNQFYMLNKVQVTRKLQVNRVRVEPYNRNTAGDFSTDQLFWMSISNNIGFSFWNSYSNDYQGGPLIVVVNDTLRMVLNSGTFYTNQLVFMNFTTNLSAGWPGSAWNPYVSPAARQAASGSFVFNTANFTCLPPSTLQLDSGGNLLGFLNQATGFDPGSITLPNLPQLVLATTNWLQAYILDGSNVVDYIEFSGPKSVRSLNNEILDPNYPDGSQVHYMWSTNASGPAQNGPNWGVMNQLYVSRTGPTAGQFNQWKSPPNMPPGLAGIPQAEAAFFNGFFNINWQYNGQTYYNTNLSVQAPFTPTRTVYEYTLWEANDPLVHYLTSDLNDFEPGWTGLHKSDDPTVQPLPAPVLNAVGDHYQPWGRNNQINTLAGTDHNPYNLAYRDPLVWGSDDWNFPATNALPLMTLGQIHRGTPWQTIYLKATNIWDSTVPAYGTTTWTNWSGDADPVDAATELPVADWRLAGLLVNWFNSNDATALKSVNDPNPDHWLNVLDGVVVQTNSAASPNFSTPPQLDAYVMSSNSPQAAFVSDAIVQNLAGQPGQSWSFAGDILATPGLAEASPWLNTSSAAQIDNGISDQAYEAIPSQLLPLLRPDSVGAMVQTNGGLRLRFSGSDGLSYALQTSADLVNWESISTNCPVHGSFIVPLPSPANPHSQFYRSVLLP